MSADATRHDDGRPPAPQVQGADEADRIGPMTKAGTRDLHAGGAQLLIVNATSVERDDRDVEAPGVQLGDQEGPLALRSTCLEVPAHEQDPWPRVAVHRALPRPSSCR